MHRQDCENLPFCITLKNIGSCPDDFCIPQQIPNAFKVKGEVSLSFIVFLNRNECILLYFKKEK